MDLENGTIKIKYINMNTNLKYDVPIEAQSTSLVSAPSCNQVYRTSVRCINDQVTANAADSKQSIAQGHAHAQTGVDMNKA